MRNSIFPKREPGSNSWLLSFSWEQRNAKELCNIGTGKSNTQDQIEDGIYPFFIRSDVPVKSNKFLYDCEAVITIGDGNIGKVFHYVNGKFDLHQRCYKMTDFQFVTGKYFFYFFSTHFYERAMKMTAKATVDSVRLEMIADMEIRYPHHTTEQVAIANFFSNLDRLITLHQCNYFFNATEMVSRNVEKTFSWEQRKLGDIAIFNPKSELPEKFEYVDLESVVGTEIIAHREEQKSTAPSRAQRLAQFGDLFYQTVRPYQKNNCLFESHCKSYVFSTGYAQIRPFFNGYFLLSLVQSDFFVKRVLDRCTGTSYPAINSNDLAEMSIKKPCDKKEIEKIGQFFRSLDRLITLHQRECFFSRIRKKLKITSQKTNAWEQRELGMVGSFYYGHSCPKWSVTEDATTPCIRYGELYTKFGTIVDRVFSYTSMPSEKLRFSKGTEVLIPRVGEDPMDYNHCTWLSLKGIAIGEMISVFNSDQNPLFMAIMFNATLQQEFAMRVEGGSVTNLYFEKLKNIEVKYPLISEQQKIGQFFQSIDRLITLHQRERLFLILEEILC